MHAAMVDSLFEVDVKGLTPFCLCQPQPGLSPHRPVSTCQKVNSKCGFSSRAQAFFSGSRVSSRLNHHRNNKDARAAESAAKGHFHLCHQQAWCASPESYHHSQKWSCAVQDRDSQGHHLQRQSCPVPLQVSTGDICISDMCCTGSVFACRFINQVNAHVGNASSQQKQAVRPACLLQHKSTMAVRLAV